MEELENEELNRKLCALAVDDMFESWSPEIQEQVLAEWNDWEEPTKPSGGATGWTGGDSSPPISHRGQFSNSSKSDEKLGGGGTIVA